MAQVGPGQEILKCSRTGILKWMSKNLNYTFSPLGFILSEQCSQNNQLCILFKMKIQDPKKCEQNGNSS